MTVIKVADDKQPQLDALAARLRRPDVPPNIRKRIDEAIRIRRAGIEGERDAAYQIDFHYGPRKGYMVIHDLRIEFADRVAQIDHLLINRALDVWVCETKAFREGVKIDEYGEWYRYGGKFAHGMASPVEQNRRHVAVLRDVFDKGAVRLPRRLVTIKPTIFSVVLISNDARIDRPKSKKAAAAVDGLDAVIKVEQLVRKIEQTFDDRSPIGILAKVVGQDTIEDLANQLVALHRPAPIVSPSRFGLPAEPPVSIVRRLPGPPILVPAGPTPTRGRAAHVARPFRRRSRRTLESTATDLAEQFFAGIASGAFEHRAAPLETPVSRESATMLEGSGSHPGWAVVDVETTGLHPVRDRIVEIAVVRLSADAQEIDEWSTLVNPGARPLGGRIHGLRTADLAGAPTFEDIRDDLLARLAGSVIVAHNAPFDVAFLQAETIRAGVAWGPIEGLCTMEVLASLGISKSRKLHQCCSELDIWAGREHVAIDDARAVAGIIAYLGPRLWAVDSPAPAPAWPAPNVAAAIKQRTAGPETAPISEVGRHFRLPPNLSVSNIAATTYLGLLDQVVEDGRVTNDEVEALGLFARSCSIDRATARQLNLAYLEEISRVARADGVMTQDEQEHLSNLVPLLSAALPR